MISALSAVRLRWPVTPAAGVADPGALRGVGEPSRGEGWFQARMPVGVFGEPHLFQAGIDQQPGRADHPAAGLEGQ